MSFEGEINGFGYNPDKESEKQERWEKHLNRKIIPYNEYDSMKYAENRLPIFKFFLSIAMIGLLLLGGFFVYYLKEGKMQSNVDVSANPEIILPINNSIVNKYNITIPNLVYNNYTIINKICVNGNFTLC